MYHCLCQSINISMHLCLLACISVHQHISVYNKVISVYISVYHCVSVCISVYQCVYECISVYISVSVFYLYNIWLPILSLYGFHGDHVQSAEHLTDLVHPATELFVDRQLFQHGRASVCLPVPRDGLPAGTRQRHIQQFKVGGMLANY